MYTELGGVSIRNRLAPFNHAFLNIGRGLLKVHREFLDQQIFKKGPCCWGYQPKPHQKYLTYIHTLSTLFYVNTIVEPISWRLGTGDRDKYAESNQ